MQTNRTPERQGRIRRTLECRQPDLTVVVENVHDPHNVSAMFRSCDAVGVLEVCLVYHGDQQYPKLGHKSSASARKWIRTRRFDAIDECFAYLRQEGKKIYTTHLSADAASLYSLDLAAPVALVFGNEHAGVSDEALALADGNFLIPQMGMIRSLNISVACAVSLYEAFRQRQAAGKYGESQLNAAELAAVEAEWLEK